MSRIITEHIADWLSVKGVSRRDLSIATGIYEAKLRKIINGTAQRVARKDMLHIAYILDILYEDLIKAPPADLVRLTAVPKPRSKPYERWQVMYDLLAQRQMSLVALAIKTGYSNRYVQEMLSGRRKISPFSHLCFAQALDVLTRDLPLPKRLENNVTQAAPISIRTTQQRI